MSNEKRQEEFAGTYGGLIGACLPLVVMLGSILVMAALGMRNGSRQPLLRGLRTGLSDLCSAVS